MLHVAHSEAALMWSPFTFSTSEMSKSYHLHHQSGPRTKHRYQIPHWKVIRLHDIWPRGGRRVQALRPANWLSSLLSWVTLLMSKLSYMTSISLYLAHAAVSRDFPSGLQGWVWNCLCDCEPWLIKYDVTYERPVKMSTSGKHCKTIYRILLPQTLDTLRD